MVAWFKEMGESWNEQEISDTSSSSREIGGQKDIAMFDADHSHCASCRCAFGRGAAQSVSIRIVGADLQRTFAARD
jgi:hypothetical protein